MVLGTRSSVTPSDSLETAVGVLEVADATYRCIARTFANGTNEMVIAIAARNSVTDRQPVYLRFYAVEETKIQETLSLSSSEFVSSMFETMVRM